MCLLYLFQADLTEYFSGRMFKAWKLAKVQTSCLPCCVRRFLRNTIRIINSLLGVQCWVDCTIDCCQSSLRSTLTHPYYNTHQVLMLVYNLLLILPSNMADLKKKLTQNIPLKLRINSVLIWGRKRKVIAYTSTIGVLT